MAHCLIHILIVRTMRTISADNTIRAHIARFTKAEHAIPRGHIAVGIMRKRPALVAHDLEIIIIKPNRMRRREIRADQVKIIHMLHQRLAIAPNAHKGLHLAFANMAMDTNTMFARQITAAAHEGIGTMMRDVGCNRRADILLRRWSTSCAVLHIPDHAFLEQVELEHLLGDDLAQRASILARRLHLIARGLTAYIPGQAAPAGVKKPLRTGLAQSTHRHVSHAP